jgi:hypothetical protein
MLLADGWEGSYEETWEELCWETWGGTMRGISGGGVDGYLGGGGLARGWGFWGGAGKFVFYVLLQRGFVATD